MAFPTTPVLDDFNRADAGTLGANWAGNLILQFGGSTSDAAIISNQCAGLAGTRPSLHFTGNTYGPDCEVFVSLSSVLPSDTHILFLRLAQPGVGTSDGYALIVDPVGNTFEVNSITNGVFTPIGATASQDVAHGDKIGFEAVGTSLTGYRFTGGSWNMIISRTDSTYTTAGLIGMYFSDETTWRGDDFGGGTVGRIDTIRAIPTMRGSSIRVF